MNEVSSHIEKLSPSNSKNSGVEAFSTPLLNPNTLQMQIAVDYQMSLDQAPLKSLVDDRGLLPDQELHLKREQPVTILILGAAGSLASGFLSRGAHELNCSLNGASPVRYIMSDIAPTNSSAADSLIARRRQEGEYSLHPTPYIAATELTEQKLQDLGVDLIISATPPNVHIDDALRAERLGIQTYIEKPAYPAGFGSEKRPIIERTINAGHVGLIDFFLGNRALIDFLSQPEHYLSGKLFDPEFSLGPIQYMHATCFEPHSVNEEGARIGMLMNYHAQGGFLYADMAPHALAIIEATLNAVCSRSLSESRIALTYRTRETDVPGPEDAETSAAVLRVLPNTTNDQRMSLNGIELLSVAGKGIQVPGGANQSALTNYMLTIGCSAGRIDLCIGNGQNTLPSYLCLTPYDDRFQARMFEYPNSGLGYCTMLADYVIAAQAQKRGDPIPDATTTRLRRHTVASLEAMKAIEEVYTLWNRSSAPIQRYGTDSSLDHAALPLEIPLACFIHGSVRENFDRGISLDLLRQRTK